MAEQIIASHVLMRGTAAEWTATDLPIGKGGVCLETDTGKMKIFADNDVLYKDAPYTEIGLEANLKAYLDNAGAAGGVVVLTTGTGMVPVAFFPEGYLDPVVVVVDDITARDAIEDETVRLVYVTDASGDNTVLRGGALYGRESGSDPWNKIMSDGSMDLDLAPYLTRDANLDTVLDGVTHVKMLPTERTDIATLKAEVVMQYVP